MCWGSLPQAELQRRIRISFDGSLGMIRSSSGILVAKVAIFAWESHPAGLDKNAISFELVDEVFGFHTLLNVHEYAIDFGSQSRC